MHVAAEWLWEADKEMMEARIPMKMGKCSKKLIFCKLDQLLFNFFYWSHEERNCYIVIRNIQGPLPQLPLPSNLTALFCTYIWELQNQHKKRKKIPI